MHTHTQHVPVVSLNRKHVPTTVFTQSLPTATLGTASQGVVMELHAQTNKGTLCSLVSKYTAPFMNSAPK